MKNKKDTQDNISLRIASYVQSIPKTPKKGIYWGIVLILAIIGLIVLLN